MLFMGGMPINHTGDEKEILPNRQRCVLRNMADNPSEKAVYHRANSRKHDRIAMWLLSLLVKSGNDKGDRRDNDGFGTT